MMLIFGLGIKVSQCNTDYGAYYFYSSTATTTQHDGGILNYNVSIFLPSAYLGSSFASNNPAATSKGYYITHGKYLVVNNTFKDELDYGIKQYGLWLYYITGTMDIFVSIDWQIGTYQGYYVLKSVANSPYQNLTLSISTFSQTFGSVKTRWNFIVFGGDYMYFTRAMGNGNDPGYASSQNSAPNYSSAAVGYQNVRRIGGFNGTDTSVEYILHSLKWTNGSQYYSAASSYIYLGITNAQTSVAPGGDGVVTDTETCDDANVVNLDGGDNSCSIELGYIGSGIPNVCTDQCGDGKVNIRNFDTYGDDGDFVGGDGGSTTGWTEAGYTGSGGSSSGPDSCIDTGGDGFLVTVRPNSTYGDDGNAINGDGGSSSGVRENGYTGTGADSTTADTCSQIGGDGKILGSRPSAGYGDDGNTIDGDGGSSICAVETGYGGSGATASLADTGLQIGGDGIMIGSRPNSTYGDDGNTASGDGGNSLCAKETGYTGSGASSTSHDVCSDTCGDGVMYSSRPNSTYGDDGNSVNGDGGSSSGAMETGYSGTGVTISSPDTGSAIGGDGIMIGVRPSATYGDDGNTASGDGGSSVCSRETGYTGTGASSSTPDVCSDTCGDGVMYSSRPNTTYGDDGNSVNGDGGSSSGAMETGYTGAGVTISSPDTGLQIGGDGIMIGTRPSSAYGDDGNTANGDGGSSACLKETGYTGIGASSSTPDVCTDICGDGALHGSRPNSTYGDDGNSINGDGGSSAGAVETGFSGSGATTSSADTGSDSGGDGTLQGLRPSSTYGDDGNSVNGDGGSSSCVVELGFLCSGASSTTADTGTDVGADGFIYGSRPSATYGDDGNSINGDGCNSIGETEVSYSGTGGSISTPDEGYRSSGDEGLTFDEAKNKGVVSTTVSSAAIAGGAIVATSMSINAVSSLMSASSSQSIFASVNQLQLILLLVLLGVYLPGKVLNLIQSYNMTLLCFDVPSMPIFRNFAWFFNLFEYDQNDDNLTTVGLSSGSTIINLMTPFITSLIIIMVHLTVWLISLCYQKTGPRNGLSRFNSKAFEGLTFGAYIRLGLESFLVILLSGVSEVSIQDESTTPKRNSIYTGYVISLCLIVFYTGVAVNMLKRKQKDYFNSEVKERFIARAYCFIALSRLILGSIILILIDKSVFFIKVVLISVLQLTYVVYIIESRPFKTAKDNMIEITNEIFYALIVGILLYANTESKWNSMLINVYVNIIIGNMSLVTLISIGFMIKEGYHRRVLKIKAKPNQLTNNLENSEVSGFDVPSQSSFLNMTDNPAPSSKTQNTGRFQKTYHKT